MHISSWPATMSSVAGIEKLRLRLTAGGIRLAKRRRQIAVGAGVLFAPPIACGEAQDYKQKCGHDHVKRVSYDGLHFLSSVVNSQTNRWFTLVGKSSCGLFR